MGEIIKLSLKNKPSRRQVINWLKFNKIRFPIMSEPYIGPDLFYGWRFITGLDGIVYFANCVDEGITEYELQKVQA